MGHILKIEGLQYYFNYLIEWYLSFIMRCRWLIQPCAVLYAGNEVFSEKIFKQHNCTVFLLIITSNNY